ncbi:LysR family transcriptional regulator [Rhizobium sp. AAP43]|uniref:LysR family transcriptional regulator n=1 Tax=Rhizobium sp. AAP43 TaxID=1523420 RepID=UPI0006B8C0E3|nr:LysR family transcriptional regulator [Rhizobium sp. AAP43]KPF42494.1 LysR family transcriptional regulator [Rhizobium sp. AAP43]
MSLIRLRSFVEVYRLRSLSAAARSLNLTQSNVSQHIAGLEVALGRKLFERGARGVIPTITAEELAADLADHLDLSEQALAKARARSTELVGAIRIIGHADFMAEVLTLHLPKLVDAGIRIRLQPAHRDMLQQMLIEGHFDLGISAYPITDTRLRTELIREEPVVAVAAPAVAERIKANPSLSEGIRSEALLSYSLDLPLIDVWLAGNGLEDVQASPSVTSPDLRVLRNLLLGGMGWSILPKYLCQDAIAEGRLHVIPPPRRATTNTYWLVWLPTILRHPRVAHARQILLRGLQEQSSQEKAI